MQFRRLIGPRILSVIFCFVQYAIRSMPSVICGPGRRRETSRAIRKKNEELGVAWKT